MTENSIGLATEFKAGSAGSQPCDGTGKYPSAESPEGMEKRRKEKEKAFRLMGLRK